MNFRTKAYFATDDASGGDVAEAEADADALAPDSEAAPEPSRLVEEPVKTEPKPPAWEVVRIAQITREKHEESRLRQAAEREVADLRARVATATPQSDFDAAVATRVAEGVEAYKKDTTQRAWVDTCNRVVMDGERDFPDFQATIATLNATGAMKDELVEAAIELGDPHRVLHQLAQNPAEAARIAALPPVRMAAALAKIAGTPTATPAPRTVSKAPAPIEPVARTGSGGVETDPEKMPPAQYADWYDARMRKK